MHSETEKQEGAMIRAGAIIGMNTIFLFKAMFLVTFSHNIGVKCRFS